MIKSVRLIGCQSWEDNTISFSTDFMNVLIADNSSGKSVFFKMLKITACPNYFTPKEQKKLIRYGCDKAVIMYEFVDGSIGICSVFPTRVIYMYAEDGKNFIKSQEPIEEMVIKTGLVHNSDKFIANLIDMDQPLLLVDSNMYENYELIKMLTESAELNEIKEKLQLNIDEFEENRKKVKFTLFDLEKVLAGTEYKDINKMESQIDFAENQFELLFRLDDYLSVLYKIKDNWVENVNYDELMSIVEICEKLKQISSLLERIKVVNKQDFVSLRDRLYFLESLQKVMTCLSKIKVINYNDFDFITNQYYNLIKIKRLQKHINKIKVCKRNEIEIVAVQFNLLQKVEKIKNLLNKIRFFTTDYTEESVYYNYLKTIIVILTTLKSIKIINVDYDNCSAELDLLKTIIRMKNILTTLKESKEMQCVALDKMEKVSQQIEENGETFICSKFGKVVYNGFSCLHDISI